MSELLKVMLGELQEMDAAQCETCAPTQHLLQDAGKPKKTWRININLHYKQKFGFKRKPTASQLQQLKRQCCLVQQLLMVSCYNAHRTKRTSATILYVFLQSTFFMFRTLKTHVQDVSCKIITHSPIRQTASTAVYPHTHDSPYNIYADIHCTIMAVILQLTSWRWAFKARNM
jgi:hypothetical protein